jgi:nitroimidazol reductase NimA-like FMN-containing flavoprotein (pyridoxamine 5'-phosphate oxidase superfamily)
MALASLRPLLREDCFRLLATAKLGRVGLSIRALPVILPVQYRMLDSGVVFRTAPGTKLTASLLGNVVAFEVDSLSEDDGQGWSVLVTGPVTEIRDPESLDQARRLELVS